MAKKNYIDLYYHEEEIKILFNTSNWQIGKDSQFYYKTLQEQNFAFLDGKMQNNLEYMMDEANFIKGVNPVSDIYYIDDHFITYRSKIVNGFDLNYLKNLWHYDLNCWQSFLCQLIEILNLGLTKGYIFPDLFTNGNILYDINTDMLNLIDNDGIQIKNRFAYLLDCYSYEVSIKKQNSIFHKYFNYKDLYFTEDYNIYAFYAYFFHYFFNFSLTQLLCDSYENFILQLKRLNIPINSGLWDSLLTIFSFDSKLTLDSSDILFLCQNYQICEKETSRILIPR